MPNTCIYSPISSPVPGGVVQQFDRISGAMRIDRLYSPSMRLLICVETFIFARRRDHPGPRRTAVGAAVDDHRTIGGLGDPAGVSMSSRLTL
jgi:hypothetical protein